MRGVRSRLALCELLAERRSRSERIEALALASAQRYVLNEVRAAAIAVAERLSAAHRAKPARGVPAAAREVPNKRARSR